MMHKKSKPKAKTTKAKARPLRAPAAGLPAKKNKPKREASARELKKLLHELRTHQIELEMQNKELLQAREDAEASRRRYADLYESSPVGYFTFDRKGLIREVNQAGVALFGMPKRFLIDKSFLTFIGPAGRAVFLDHLAEAFRTQTRGLCEIELKTKKGVLVPVQLLSIVVHTGEGIPDSCRAIVVDIAERKRAEEALRESERRERLRAEELATLLEAVPMPVIIVHDTDGTHMTGNRAADELLQRPRGAEISLSAPPEVKPDHFRAIKDGRELRLDELPAQRAARGEQVRDFEFSLVFDDGTTRHLLGYGTPLHDEHGRPRGAVHVLADITRHKQAENAQQQYVKALELARSEVENEKNLLAAIMETLPTGVAITDSRGGNIRANSAFERIWRGPRPQTRSVDDYAAYQAWWSDTGKPVAPEEWASAIAVRKDETVIGQVLRIQRFDGSDAFVINSAAPVHDTNGKIIGCAVAIQDITALKQTEKALSEQELKASALINVTDESIWLFSLEDDVLTANRTAAQRLGKRVDEVVGKKWTTLVPPAVAELRKNKVEEVVRTGAPARFEDERGGMIFDHSVLPVRNAEGILYAVAFFSRDITLQKRNEEERERLWKELQQRAVELDAMFKVLPYLVSQHDVDGRYVRANPALLNLFGFDPTSSTREETARRLHARFPDGRPLTPESMPSTRALKGEAVFDVEYLISDNAGEDHMLLMNAIPLKINDQVYGVVIAQMDITDRKLAEEALRESEERFRLLVEQAVDGIFMADAQGRYIDVNTAGARMLGYTREEVCRLTVLDVISPAEIAHMQAQMSAVTSGSVTRNEWQFRCKDGSTFIGEVVGRQLPDGRLLGILRDVTERKQAEEALRLSEEKFATAFANNPAAVVMTRLEDGVFVDVNNTWLSMNGYNRDEVIGRTARKLHLWPSVESAARFVQELRDKGTLSGWELAFRKKSGEAYFAQLSAEVLTVHGEQVVLSTLVDISERMRALNSLKESEERFRILSENSPDCIALHDRDLRHLYVNPAIALVAGLPREAFLGKTVLEMNMPPEGAKILDQLLRPVLETGQVQTSELMFPSNEGPRYYLWRSVPIHDADGAINAVLAIASDITERKMAEEKLRIAHLELEQRAFELDAVNRELEAFAYTVSHDLKAPLRSIDGFARAITEDYHDKLDDTGKDYVRRVMSACQRMSQLIDAMLNMSRQTRGDLHEKVVDLSSLAQVAVRNLQKRDAGRQVDIVIAENVKVKGDATMLEVVLQNLLDNAWKFTGKRSAAKIEFGVISLEFGETTRNTPNSQLPTPNAPPVYYVRDNGAGFDMQYADKLFMPFKRMHTESEFPGLGIGLAIAHRIIMRHGGRMWAESAPEKGTTFFFTI